MEIRQKTSRAPVGFPRSVTSLARPGLSLGLCPSQLNLRAPNSKPVAYEKETNPLVPSQGQLFTAFLSCVGCTQSLEGSVAIEGLGLC